MMKKILALTAALAMLTAVATGCGSDEESSKEASSAAATEAAEESSEEEPEVDETDADENTDDSADDETAAYANALAGTLWLGMDSEYNCYALGFNDEEIVFEANDGSSVSGYWGVTAGDPTIYIFEDADLTNQVASLPWSYDTENDLMILNDTVIMTQADSYSFDEAAAAMEQMATAAKVQEFLQGTYWVGVDDDGAIAMGMDGKSLEMVSVDTEGNLDDLSCLWSMDYDALTLYDDSYAPVYSFGWDIAEDGSVLELTDSDGSTVSMQQVSEEDATDIIAYLYASLNLDYTEE